MYENVSHYTLLSRLLYAQESVAEAYAAMVNATTAVSLACQERDGLEAAVKARLQASPQVDAIRFDHRHDTYSIAVVNGILRVTKLSYSHDLAELAEAFEPPPSAHAAVDQDDPFGDPAAILEACAL